MNGIQRLREIAARPLCPSMTEDGIRHVARNVDHIECTCDPECPDEAWWDRYDTAGDLLAMHAAMHFLLDVAEAAETVDEECGVTHADLANALDRLREVTS